MTEFFYLPEFHMDIKKVLSGVIFLTLFFSFPLMAQGMEERVYKKSQLLLVIETGPFGKNVYEVIFDHRILKGPRKRSIGGEKYLGVDYLTCTEGDIQITLSRISPKYYRIQMSVSDRVETEIYIASERLENKKMFGEMLFRVVGRGDQEYHELLGYTLRSHTPIPGSQTPDCQVLWFISAQD